MSFYLNTETLSSGNYYLTNVSQVISEEAIVNPTTSLSASISAFIDAVSWNCQEICGPLGVNLQFEGIYQGDINKDYIRLRNIPAISVQNVYSRDNFYDSWTALPLTGFNISYAKLSSTANFQDKEYRVIYTTGYSTVPTAIQNLVVRKTRIFLRQSNINQNTNVSKNSLGVSSRTTFSGVPVTENFTDLTEEEIRILETFKRKRIVSGP